jgi:hypothetical protein
MGLQVHNPGVPSFVLLVPPRRWTKGHMQIFFSRRCPLVNWKLLLVHKILYTNGTWA